VEELESKTILLSACGSPGTAALIRALRTNGERDIRLVGTDMSTRSVGRHLCDAFHLVPPGTDAAYVPALMRIASEEHVDVILPQSSYELERLAEHRSEFGCAVLVSGPKTVRACNDKAECYDRLHALGVRAPRFVRTRGGREVARAASELGYPERPVCFKPVVSSGSRGYRVLDASVNRAHALLNERPGFVAMRLEEALAVLPEEGGPELIVMELAEGGERTIDGVADGKRIVLGHAKTREELRAGLAMYFITLDDPLLMELAERVVAGFEIEHFFNIQLVGDVVIEINPRISTLVYQEDLNMAYLGVKRALGEIGDAEMNALSGRIRPGRTALRYFDQFEWDDFIASRP
jgi:carbamoyl-phosphate synthase large subunit